jgi:hypothetical protein
MELASCYLSVTHNVEVFSRFLEKLNTPVIIFAELYVEVPKSMCK